MRPLLLILVAVVAGAQTLDRVAVSVDQTAITERELLEAIRLTAFLARQPADFSGRSRRAAADRLVDQALLEREMRLNRLPRATAADIAGELEAEAARSGSRKAFLDDLARYQLTEDLLVRYLAWQATVLRFIDFRFRPAVQIADADLEARYRAFARDFRRDQQREPPSFEEARPGLERLLIEERVNLALERFLGEARTEAVIRYRDQVFR